MAAFVFNSDFPKDLAIIQSFNMGSNWMALSQPGYDLLDNTNGVLIKTAGYPGGISSTKTFGVVNFSAKKEGIGKITATANSMILNGNNQNVLSGTPIDVNLNISAIPVPVKTPTITPKQTPVQTETPSISPQPTITESPAPNVASLLNIPMQKSLIIIMIVLLAVTGFLSYLVIKRKRNIKA